MIAEPLLALAVPLDTLQPHPRNPRRGDLDSIAASLAEFTQYKPVVVQKSTGYICAGNHTWAAAKRLGWSEIAAVLLDIDDSTAIRIIAGDNRTSELGSFDNHSLAEMLKDIGRDDAWRGTGYFEEDLDNLLDSIAEDLLAEATEPDAGAAGAGGGLCECCGR